MPDRTDRHPNTCPCCGNDYPGDFCRNCLEDRENHDCSAYPDTRKQPVRCAVCEGQHPKNDSVTVVSTGLSAGIECLSPRVRELFGVPTPDEVRERHRSYPLMITTGPGAAHRLFTITTQTINDPPGPGTWEEHLQEALEKVGLDAIPEIHQNAPSRFVRVDSLGRRGQRVREGGREAPALRGVVIPHPAGEQEPRAHRYEPAFGTRPHGFHHGLCLGRHIITLYGHASPALHRSVLAYGAGVMVSGVDLREAAGGRVEKPGAPPAGLFLLPRATLGWQERAFPLSTDPKATPCPETPGIAPHWTKRTPRPSLPGV